jgi:UDP-2,3-diacylglucosamine pyrophosphatase LpxH
LYNRLKRLKERTPSQAITDADRIVIFSDLHLGNGGRKDDFLHNSELFIAAVSRYYYPLGHTLVLNGDIEDMQKFPPFVIRRAWESVFLLLERFYQGSRLIRTWGNHDELLALRPGKGGRAVVEGFRFLYKGSTLFVFHGHQASKAFHRYNTFLGYLVRFLISPLGIMNDSVAHDNRRKYKIEKRIYEFSSKEKIISIIGHTHRPLFESLSKTDSLRFRIEDMCRRYPETKEDEKGPLAEEIRATQKELRRLFEKNKENGFESSLYESHFAVPCIFNSGCATGKRGITCLEIEGGRIRLVHWYDRNFDTHAEGEAGGICELLEDTDYCRLILKEDNLDYIFTRINLLT